MNEGERMWQRTCDEAGDDQRQDEHLQHPHEDFSGKGDHSEGGAVRHLHVAQQHPKHGAHDNTWGEERLLD